MQCFWGVESSFAKISGVKKTAVGYAGGTTASPNYTRIGDHTEVAEVHYDPTTSDYTDLLDWFFLHHNPTVIHKKQYQSAILYVDDEQKAKAEKAIERANIKFGKVETYLKKIDTFYTAENYHQKYWLRCQPTIYRQLGLTDAELIDSTLAAKINAFLAGYDNFPLLKQLGKEHNLSNDFISVIETIARAGGDSRSCH